MLQAFSLPWRQRINLCSLHRRSIGQGISHTYGAGRDTMSDQMTGRHIDAELHLLSVISQALALADEIGADRIALHLNQALAEMDGVGKPPAPSGLL